MTGVQTCALPISDGLSIARDNLRMHKRYLGKALQTFLSVLNVGCMDRITTYMKYWSIYKLSMIRTHT